MSFNLRQRNTRLLLTLLLTLLVAASAWAGMPELAPAKSDAGPDKCVEPVAEMRRNHFEKILHQRVDTVREGIRTKKHSLARCINCHVSKIDGKYPDHKDKRHFCATCHQYAGITIDCFECHRDKPGSDKDVGLINNNNKQVAKE